jgi:hypothetical protein
MIDAVGLEGLANREVGMLRLPDAALFLNLCLPARESAGPSSHGMTRGMNMNTAATFGLSLGLVGLLASGANASTIYSSDFSSGVGTEWSSQSTYTHSVHGEMIGRFGSGTESITLNTTVGQTYEFSFDLMTFGTWNGHSQAGEDFFSVRRGSDILLEAKIDSDWTTSQHEFAAPDAVYNDGQLEIEMLFRDVTVTFVATDSTTRLDFVSAFTIASNEFWAVNNVTASEVPSGGALSMMAIAGVAMLRRERRKA